MKGMVLVLAAGIVWLQAVSAGKVFYDIDFSAPQHTAGKPPRVSSSGEDISKIIFGKPLIAVSEDAGRNQYLAFNTEGNQPDFFYDQIQIDLYGSTDFYYLSFEINTNRLINSRNQFSVFGPLKLEFTNTGKILIDDRHEVPYSNRELYLIEIIADYKNSKTTCRINKTEVYTSETAKRSKELRFSLGVVYNTDNIDNSSTVGLDNLFVADCIPVETDELAVSNRVDQSQNAHDYIGDLSSDGKAGQTFTAGMDGSLVGLRLLVQGSRSQKADGLSGADFKVELHRVFPTGVIQDRPVTSGITSRQAIDSKEAKWVTVVFERPYKQKSGERLAFTILDLGGGGRNGYNNYGHTRSDAYAGGVRFLTYSAQAVQGVAGDMAFATLVSENEQTEQTAKRPLAPARGQTITFPDLPAELSDKLAVLWTDGTIETGRQCIRYAYNSKSLCWFDEVKLVVLGPSVKALADDPTLQKMVSQLAETGVVISVSSDMAKTYDVGKSLDLAGIKLEASEHILSQMIKSGWRTLTF